MANARLSLPHDAPGWLNLFAASVVKYLNLLLNRATLTRALKSVTTAYSATADDSTILADATGGAFTVTLPLAGTVTGLVLTVKRMNAGANAVTVDGNGAETIDGAANASLASQYASVTVQSDGTAWVKL